MLGLDCFDGPVRTGHLQHRVMRRPGKSSFSPDQLPTISGDQIQIFVRSHLLDQGVFSSDNRWHIHRPRGSGNPGVPGRVRGPMTCPGSSQECFRRHTPGVDTGATHRATLDHHHTFTQGASPDCRSKSGTPRANNRKIHHLGGLMCSHAWSPPAKPLPRTGCWPSQGRLSSLNLPLYWKVKLRSTSVATEGAKYADR